VTATDSSIQASQEGALLREMCERLTNPRDERLNQGRRERWLCGTDCSTFHNDDCLTDRTSTVLSLPSLQTKAESEINQGY
jgi:hypothetical protein